MKYLFSFLVITMLFSSCNKEINREALLDANFYHWKINANLENSEKEALKTANSPKVFLHYFDVVESYYSEKPVAVLRAVDEVLKGKEIVPVIFIKNAVFKGDYFYGKSLVKKIIDLTKEIREHHFNKMPNEIQIDCDWTESTRENYFKFLTLLKKEIAVSVTIRLHQIKYKGRTGVPPVDSGALMLYNVGDLKERDQNSILESDIVSQYISKNTEYPLTLDVALPIFSQVVVINNEGSLKLINEPNFEKIKNDAKHFKEESPTEYKVLKKILYKGHYLYEGFTIKLEESNIDEIVKSREILINSNLVLKDVILYHLDDKTLDIFNLTELLEKLK